MPDNRPAVPVAEQLHQALAAAFPDGQVRVEGDGRHFTVQVVSAAFAGQGPVQRQRAVYRAIRHLMQGDDAPVHAIDRMDLRPA